MTAPFTPETPMNADTLTAEEVGALVEDQATIARSIGYMESVAIPDKRAEAQAAGDRAVAAVRRLAAALEAQPARVVSEAAKALAQAENWFRDYERQHLAKNTDDGDRRAATNLQRANHLRDVRLALFAATDSREDHNG